MLLPKKCYVIQSNQNNKLEFEFNTVTQENYFKTLKGAKEELELLYKEYENDLDVVKFKIYEMNLTQVK